jgi:hypothetical protein
LERFEMVLVAGSCSLAFCEGAGDDREPDGTGPLAQAFGKDLFTAVRR